jgi:lipopolysaccharide transport system permease protein
LVVAALSFFQHDILLNLLLFTWLPLLNLLLFVYWVPLLVCLLGAFIRDLYQLVPIVLQLIFLLSPILYTKTSLGRFGFAADINPFYRILSPVRQSLMQGKFDVLQCLALLVFNLIGISIALYLLEKQRSKLPFLV